jgi:hypothetical protein
MVVVGRGETRTEADPYGMTNKRTSNGKNNGNSKSNSKSDSKTSGQEW